LPETCWATSRREINNTKVTSSWFFLSTLNPYSFQPCLLFHKKILFYGITSECSCTILPKTFRINRWHLTECCKTIITIISMPIAVFNFQQSTTNYHPYSFRTAQNLCQDLSRMHELHEENSFLRICRALSFSIGLHSVIISLRRRY
jgi:hypothetical protein